MILQNTNINIRISKNMKDKFVEVARKNGVNYSMVLRNMIRDYISNNGKCDYSKAGEDYDR